MRIIDQFEEARQQELNAARTRCDNLKRKLTALYKDGKSEIEAGMKAMKKRPVADLEKQWNDHQQHLWAKMDEALAACE